MSMRRMAMLVIAPLFIGATIPGGPAITPKAHAIAVSTCYWTPDDEVWVLVNESQVFDPGFSNHCVDYDITISPANGTAALASDCSTVDYSTKWSGMFEVFGCAVGDVTVSISDGSATVQTITVHVINW